MCPVDCRALYCPGHPTYSGNYTGVALRIPCSYYLPRCKYGHTLGRSVCSLTIYNINNHSHLCWSPKVRIYLRRTRLLKSIFFGAYRSFCGRVDPVCYTFGRLTGFKKAHSVRFSLKTQANRNKYRYIIGFCISAWVMAKGDWSKWAECAWFIEPLPARWKYNFNYSFPPRRWLLPYR